MVYEWIWFIIYQFKFAQYSVIGSSVQSAMIPNMVYINLPHH